MPWEDIPIILHRDNTRISDGMTTTKKQNDLNISNSTNNLRVTKTEGKTLQNLYTRWHVRMLRHAREREVQEGDKVHSPVHKHPTLQFGQCYSTFGEKVR